MRVKLVEEGEPLEALDVLRAYADARVRHRELQTALRVAVPVHTARATHSDGALRGELGGVADKVY